VRCDIRIGTSGWHYKHWLGPFYPADVHPLQMLSFYVDHFNTVEINNTFYHLPLPGTLDTWRRRTPPAFCFAVKASRFLTHMKKLKDPEQGLARFLPLVERLKHKLGPVLFQLPPRWACDADRLESFLQALPRRHRYSFEFRDSSWHAPMIYRLLERYDVAFCIYQLAGFSSPIQLTTDFTYIRLHGPTSKAYQGSYDDASLTKWAERIDGWQTKLKSIYVYFDNDQSGFAAKNALQLKLQVG
jgi:uncharacterized protein YecE (DUF72 family)